MKILIDGQTLRTPEINRGIGKYFTNTVESMLAADLANDFYINAVDSSELKHLSPWTREKLSIIPHKNSEGRCTPAQYSDQVSDAIAREGIDVYWSPNGLMNNVFLPARQVNDCQFAVTIFDLIPAIMEEHYQKNWPAEVFRQYQSRLQLLESDYDLYLHISRHTQHDFTRTLKVSEKTHVVTPLAADATFQPYGFPVVAREKEYVLYPGGFDPRKNMDRALETFAELHRTFGRDKDVAGTRLLIVCQYDRASKIELLNRAKSLGIDEKLDLAGFVSDIDLVGLYQKARCLFFPSLYEGFGLPVLEGLACGLPVAASNTSSIPEVAGDFAMYFDPLNVEDMAGTLYQTLKAPVDYESRMRRHNYSKQFSWQRTALLTLQAFADIGKEVGSNASCAVTK